MNSLIKLIKRTYALAAREERQIVLKNFVSLSILQTLTYLLPIIVFPYLFRTLGADKFGLISFAQAFVQYFMILTDYGFSVSATKEISLCRDHHAEVCRVFSSVMTVKIALAFVSLLAMGAIVYFVPRFRNDWMVYVFSFGTVIGNTLFPVWFFQGTEKMKHITELNILGGVIFLASVFLFVKGPQDYLMVPIINSAVFLTTGVMALRVAFRRLGVKFIFPEYKNIKQQLKGGWDIFISIVAINAYTTTRIFAVGLLTNNVTTGLYSVAEKIANFFQTFPIASFSQALFPRLSKIFYRNKEKAFEIMRHLQLITTIAALIILPIIFIFSPLIIKIFCGGDYPKAILTLQVLLVSVFFIVSNAFRVQFLLVSAKTHIYSRIHVVMALVGMPLMFLLIYSFSYLGAAIATVIIEAGIFTITYFTIKRLNFPHLRAKK